MTSQITFLLLVSLLAPSRQQGKAKVIQPARLHVERGQQFFFGGNQQQRFYQQPLQQYFRTSSPTPDYAQPEHYEPDLKTSDVSFEYQHQLPQYQLRRQYTQGGFAPVQQHVPIVPPLSQKPITFYDQTFDPYTSQNFQRSQHEIRHPVSVRPETYLEHFDVQPPPRTNNFQVNTVKIPVAISKQNRKDGNQPKQVQPSAKFNSNERQREESNTSGSQISNENQNNVRVSELKEFGLRRNRVDPTSFEKVTPAPRNWQNLKRKEASFEAETDNSSQNASRFLIRNNPQKNEKSVKPSTEKPEASTIRLRVPFEDQVLPLQRRPIPLTSKHPLVIKVNHEPEEQEDEEENEEEEEETDEIEEDEGDAEDYSEEYEEHVPEIETHRSKQSMNMLAPHLDRKIPSKQDENQSEYEYTSEEEEDEVPEGQEENQEEEEEGFSEEQKNSDKNHVGTTTQASKQVPTPRSEVNKETTESWVIVASVQTSRSVSGARFLPSGVVNQKERNETLSEEGGQKYNASRPKTRTTTTKAPSPATARTTTTTSTTSTESINDKLDRVQSELSSGILSGDFKHFSEDSVLEDMPMPDLPEVQTSAEKPHTTSTAGTTTTTASTTTTTTTTTSSPSREDESEDTTPFLVRRFSPASKRTTTTPKPKKKLTSLIESLQFDDLSGLLPPGFKPRNSFRKTTTTTSTTAVPILSSEETSTETSTESRTTTRKYGFKPKSKNKPDNSGRSISSEVPQNKIKFEENISAFLPPDYKAKMENATVSPVTSTTTATSKPSGIQTLLGKIKFEEPVALLPKNYSAKTATGPPKQVQANQTKPAENTSKNKDIESLFSKVKQVDVNAFLPPGFKSVTTTVETTTTPIPTKSTATVKPSAPTGGVVVFPARPGGVARKPFGHQTTEKPLPSLLPEIPKIQKGWPVRATTAFSGWPTPSTTPISIEKLLEQAKTATSSSTATTTTTKTTTTTTSTTTTPKPTTPGVCTENCELAATIKIVDGVEWIPEYLDRNTKEWQELANEVESQLDYVYKSSDYLSPWYKKIRIDSFSKGSVLVDYFVELSDMSRQISTQEMKKLFHESLKEIISEEEDKELSQKIINGEEVEEDAEQKTPEKTFKLGKFSVDPKFTDFVVIQKDVYPTVGYAEEDNFLPQWAIAVIVIGLASLLFVIIFGVTVLVNRHKNNKKKTPTPLTEDIINEMNKHHIGGFDNYGADDLYGMDDVWNDRGYEKPQKKRSHGSYADNSMTNLYDSWRSDWNGYYYNSYYGNGSGGGSGYGGRRRSDYDTNF